VRHLIQPNRASCFATCAAMITDQTVEEVFEELGHNGLDIYWPNLKEPMCYRGFTPQEIVLFLMAHGWAAIEYMPTFMYGPTPSHVTQFTALDFTDTVRNQKCAIIGFVTWDNQHHFAVWDGERVIDPNGETRTFDSISSRIRMSWILARIKSAQDG